MASDQTEKASPQRRQKARKEGDLVHSRELSSSAGMLAGVLLIGVVTPHLLTAWRNSLHTFLALGRSQSWDADVVDATLRSLVTLSFAILSPAGLIAIGVCGASLGAGLLQSGGVHLHPQAVGLKMDRINPVNNLKSLVSLRSTARLLKSLLPAAALVIFAVQRISHQQDLPPFSSVRLIALGRDVYGLFLATAWLHFAWSLVDYMVEWQSREQRLKMSRQDQRDEYRELEGNPQIRGRIRSLQRQVRRRRMKADLAKAAVVITNPTHYAVALDFDFGTMDAPKVLAKGRNLIAEEIKEQACWAGVPILENAPLARSLYRSVEVGEVIPVALYAAVASILAFLYRQRVEEELRSRRKQSTSSVVGERPYPARDEQPEGTNLSSNNEISATIATIPSSDSKRRRRDSSRDKEQS